MYFKGLTEEELQNKYSDWWGNRDKETLKLSLEIAKYEGEYFEDFTLEPGSPLYDLYQFVSEVGEPLPMYLEDNYYTFHLVSKLSDCALGQTNYCEKTISITPDGNTKETILHEMIHAYTDILESNYPIIAENMIIQLYKKLSVDIPNLDSKIKEHSEMYSQYLVEKYGGYHGLLFFLKSLDLDLRCNYPFGTVCGYGRADGSMFY